MDSKASRKISLRRLPFDASICLSVTQPLREALAEIAAMQSRTVSDVVRECIVKYLSDTYERFDDIYDEKLKDYSDDSRIFRRLQE